MSTRYLGQTLDIHTSSRNLIFPHHENEIAIAEALTGKPLARYWLHSELLLVDGKMMSAEANNMVTLDDLLLRGFTPREVRFMLLSVHYRKPLNFSFKRLINVRTALRRIDEFTCKLLCLPPGKPHPEIVAFVSAMTEQFFEAMDDDLNVSKAMGAIYKFIKTANPILHVNHLDHDQKKYILESFNTINQILQIFRLKGCPLAPAVNTLIARREKARAEKDWQSADDARDELLRQGIQIIDTVTGPVWKPTDETQG
jgi:cysteinyl-tRNA synthetase